MPILIEPTIAARAPQPYVSMRRNVTMDTIAEIADRIPEVLGWMAAHGIEPVGAPFLRYRSIDLAGDLDMEAGAPIAAMAESDERVQSGLLPGGRYAVATYVGSYDRLVDVTSELLEWAASKGLAWDKTELDGAQEWGCRLEIYRTNPAEESDPMKWETELAFLLAD